MPPLLARDGSRFVRSRLNADRRLSYRCMAIILCTSHATSPEQGTAAFLAATPDQLLFLEHIACLKGSRPIFQCLYGREDF
jgi:hypothetical protein